MTAPAPCPDCSGVAVGNVLEHDAGCPIGLAADATMDADARFFEQHPTRSEYRRPITPAEIEELRSAGVWIDAPGRVVGQVLVLQISPGLRSRYFGELSREPDGPR